MKKMSCGPSGDKVNIWLNTVVASEVPFREQFKPRETDTISRPKETGIITFLSSREESFYLGGE